MTKAKFPATERVVQYATPSPYWVIPSEKGDFHLSQNLLPAMTQAESAKYISPEGYQTLALPGHIELFGAVKDLSDKGGDVEQARQFLQTALRNNFPNTQTRVRYMPRGKDKIIHNYGRESQKIILANLIGEDGRLSSVLSLDASLALTGRKPEEVEEIISYINKTPAYFWRVTSKPAQKDERVVGFDAGSGGAGLSCYRFPGDRGVSLGVRFVAQK